MISCPKCQSTTLKKSGMINQVIMSKSGKRNRKIQAYRCNQGHFFSNGETESFTNSFIEFVVFVYLRCLSLNTAMEIIRATYEDEILSKTTILDFLEKVADQVPTLDDIDNLFHPKRSGFIALDGVWFKFRGLDIVLLVCFDPETFDIIDALWSLQEDEKSYTTLLTKVIAKIGRSNIKGVYGDGDKGLINSLKLQLPTIPFQICIVHKEMRMGQVVPVKMINISKRIDERTKLEIRQFQALFRAVIYAKDKEESIRILQDLKSFTKDHPNEKFKKAFRSLLTNFKYTLTHFDHTEMQRDNNLLECFNGIIKPRLRLMKGFKKYSNLDRYLKLFLLEYRFRPLRESRFTDRRNLSPLQVAEVELPKIYNFLTFLRTSLKLNFTVIRT
jgi:hypothetical protein